MKDMLKKLCFIIFVISSLVSVYILRLAPHAVREEYQTFTTIVFAGSVLVLLYLYLHKET